jgi:hypothetical protein
VSSPDDKAFDEYLGRASQVSQRYRALEVDTVPSHLDAKILAQAADALARESDELSRVRNKRRRLLQWSVPAAVAASALLVVSIVIRSGTQHEIASVSVPVPVPATSPPRMDSQAAKPGLADKQESPAVVMIAPPRDAVTEFSSLGRSPAPGSTARSDISDSANREQALVRGLTSMSQPEPIVPAPAAAPPPPVSARMREEVSLAERSAQRVTQTAQVSEEKRAARQLELEQVVVTSSRPAAVVQDSPMAISAIEPEELGVARLHENPEDWLKHIRELRRDGEDAAADREWKEFQEAWPDHPVAETDAARGKKESQ